jgi:hypothetical protein
MIKFDEETNEIQVIESFSWETVKHFIECAKDHFKDMYENDDLPQEDAEKIEVFLNWDPEKDKTPVFGADKKDLLRHLTDEMTNDEWSDFFNADSSIRNALAEWLSEEFGYDMEACEIFPDMNV